jgi:O-antigen/teichoic acid export membrane protein
MDVSEYGVFAFATAVQGVGSIVSDMGCRDAAIGLAGPKSADDMALSRIVGAAFRFRFRLWVMASLIGCVFLLGFHFQQQLLFSKALLLSLIISVTLYVNGWSLYYPIPALINHQMAQFYRPQIVGAAARLLAVLALMLSGLLDAVSAFFAGALAALVTGFYYRSAYRSSVVISAESRDAVRQIRGYVLSVAPATLFTAFQDQVLIFVLAILGQTRNVAEVFALGRIGQMLQLLGSANLTLVMPWVSKADHDSLPSRYGLIVGGAISLAAIILLAVLCFPSEVLLVLGRNYRGLGFELQLSVATACLSYLNSVMWSINSARRWVWPWSGALYVVALLATQIWCIVNLDLSTTRGALFMSLATACVAIAYQVLHNILGFRLRTNALK